MRSRISADASTFSRPSPRAGSASARSQQRHNLLRRVRLQNVHFHPGKQWRNHLERRILGRRSNQQNVSRLHMRQKRVLLRAIKAMHFIHKHNRALAVTPHRFRLRHHFLDFFDSGKHRAERNELRFGHPRNNPRKRSLPASRRSPQEQGSQIIALDLHPQGLPRPEQLLLPDKFIKRLGPHPVSQRPPRRRLLFRLHSLK